jgi:hypothetical protein
MTLLLVLVIGSMLAVITNVVNIQFPVFNPSPPVVWRYFQLYYPENSLHPLVDVYVNLTTSGDFVQGQPITMYVSGSITVGFLHNLTSVYPYGYVPNSTNPMYQAQSNDSAIYVGFAGAPLLAGEIPLLLSSANLTMPSNYYSPTGTAVQLVINKTNPNILILINLGVNASAFTQTITWTAQGDYNPEIVFYSGIPSSNSEQRTAQIYDSIVIHIDSSETLETARYNRIDEVVSVVLAVFVLVEASKLIYEFAKKD